MAQVRVLLVGLEPSIVDFSDPAFAAHPGMTAETIQAGIDHDIARLREQGYDADFCGTDYGATASDLLRSRLAAKPYDCIVIGAGIRLFAKNTALLEQLVNIVHAEAPHAKLAFNTNPADTAEAVQRWFPTAG